MSAQTNDSQPTDRRLSDVVRWALEVQEQPATAAANWLARDIDPDCRSAIQLLTNSTIPLEHLRQAKHVFKTMRMVGETKADRRLGGQLYLAAIAAAIVYHDKRISRQSDRAVRRALVHMTEEKKIAPELQVLANNALRLMNAPEINGEVSTGRNTDAPNRQRD